MKLWHRYSTNATNRILLIIIIVCVLMLIAGSLGLLFPNLYSGILKAFDNPDYSEEEVCALIWDRLPNELEEYYMARFVSNTRKATDQGDGKLLFEVSGSDKRSFREYGGETRPKIYLEPYSSHLGSNPFNPIIQENQSRWVSKIYELKLYANFYERTGIVEVIGINSTLIKTSTGEWAWDN